MQDDSSNTGDVIKFFAEAPPDVYELAKQTNPLLKKCIELAKEFVSEGEAK